MIILILFITKLYSVTTSALIAYDVHKTIEVEYESILERIPIS